MNIVLLGAPASGKGTQSEKIINEFGFIHISTGDIVRNNINNQTEYGIKSFQYVKKGQLVPYSLIIDMLNDFLIKNDDIKNIIWDGFPRTIKQATELDVILKNKSQKIDIVFYLKVDENIAMNRSSNRVVCAKCKRTYNLETAKPKKANHCDFDNEFLLKRTDDDLSKFKIRLKEYESETKPLLNFYKNKIIELNSNENDNIVWNKIKEFINDYN